MSNRRWSKTSSSAPPGLLYQENFLSPRDKETILKELGELHPIWEYRYSQSNPPPPGQTQRLLLRPVYWLGNWQFACLNYYHPPKGIDYRCVEAEPFSCSLQDVIERIENLVHHHFSDRDIPRHWHLNTCLVNYYGSRLEGDRWVDGARVGEHKDFEPGPVASLSFGERALFQFVESFSKDKPSRLIKQMWLADNSLQIFGSDQWKKRYFHRVQRVEKKLNVNFTPDLANFRTRRLNLTFRYVPREHILPLARFPSNLIEDLRPSVKSLAQHSHFFAEQLASLTEK